MNTINKSGKKILILSHGFNMDGRAASQTITDKIPFFLEKGYELFVLSAITGRLDDKFFHQQILPCGANALRFDMRHWLRNKIGMGFIYKLTMLIVSIILLPFSIIEKVIFGLQSQWSWSISAYFYALKLIKNNKIDIVYSTGGAYSAHLAALWLKKKCNIKWIAEVHDPMVSTGNPIKGRDKKFQAKLEKNICKYADHIWWFTDGALNSAKNRNPELANKGFVVLPGSNPPNSNAQYNKSEQLHFVHLGSISSTRSLLPFLQAINNWYQQNPQLRKLVVIDIYGSSLDTYSEEYIRENNLSDIINCYGRLEFDKETGKSGREQIMDKMFTADCLILLHGEDRSFCPEYIPSKLYEYFWAKRPIIALIYQNQLLEKLIIERGGTVCDTTNIAEIQVAINNIYNNWKENTLEISKAEQALGVKQAVDTIIINCNL